MRLCYPQSKLTAKWIMALAIALGLSLITPARADYAFRFSFGAIEGDVLPLETFRGQPLLVVNTASFCGFTHQYRELQVLYDRYRDRGLVVLGVPSNDFNQEMEDNAAIKEFCEVTFGIDFPLTEQVSVSGPDSHPLFKYFRDTLGPDAGPNWNFYKYLVAPDGRVVGGWSPRVAPTSRSIIEAVEHLLPAS